MRLFSALGSDQKTASSQSALSESTNDRTKRRLLLSNISWQEIMTSMFQITQRFLGGKTDQIKSHLRTNYISCCKRRMCCVLDQFLARWVLAKNFACHKVAEWARWTIHISCVRACVYARLTNNNINFWSSDVHRDQRFVPVKKCADSNLVTLLKVEKWQESAGVALSAVQLCISAAHSFGSTEGCNFIDESFMRHSDQIHCPFMAIKSK